VALIRFKNRASREWWAVHVEAWQRSGLTKARYCRQQGLGRSTFSNWVGVIADVKALATKRELENERRREVQRKKRTPMAAQLKSQAVRSFWAMHVEALRWSGMPLNGYARALHLSRFSLRKWRDLLEGGEVQEDWRGLLHPAARAVLSTSAKASAKEPGAETGLTSAPDAAPGTPKKPVRRSFSHEEKLAMVLESERPGETVSAVARRHDIVSSMLFRWRDELGFGRDKKAKLATVKVSGDEAEGAAQAPLLRDLIAVPDGMVAVDLNDGRRALAPADSDPQAVRDHVAKRENRPC
jgi:transposase-like protein